MEEQNTTPQPETELFDWGEAGQGAPEEQPQEAAEPTLTVKYHGKEQDLPMSEARTLAQKGMAFDDVSQKLDTVLPAYRLLEAYAQKAGVSVDQYLENARSRLDAPGTPAPDGRQQQFVQLLTRYPDAVDENGRLPDAVMAQVARGEHPVHAFERYALERYRMGESARLTDARNRASVPGSAQGLGADAPQDPFSAGWDSDI